jgi:hypothetical protein
MKHAGSFFQSFLFTNKRADFDEISKLVKQFSRGSHIDHLFNSKDLKFEKITKKLAICLNVSK